MQVYTVLEDTNLTFVYRDIFMKVITISLLGFCLAAFVSTSFADTYRYDIDNIEELKVSAGVEFNLSCGNVRSLEISADSEEDFDVSIKDNRLEIKANKKSSSLFSAWRYHEVSADIRLQYPPKVVGVSSGSEGKMRSCFTGDMGLDEPDSTQSDIEESDLRLSVSSGASFEMDNLSGFLNQMDVGVSSGAGVEIGEALRINYLSVDASSGANFEAASDVLVKTAAVSASSGASVEICGVAEVSGKVSSGGSLEVAEQTISTGIKKSSGGSLDKDCG